MVFLGCNALLTLNLLFLMLKDGVQISTLELLRKIFKFVKQNNVKYTTVI